MDRRSGDSAFSLGRIGVLEVLATVADSLKLTDGSAPRIGLPSSAGTPALAAAAHTSTAEPEAARAAKEAAKEPERVLERFAPEEKHRGLWMYSKALL